MTCRNVQQLHDAFLDGNLPASLTAEVHAHLLQCPQCQRQVEMLRACGSVIRKDPPAAGLPDDFADRIADALPAVHRPPASPAFPDGPRLSWRLLRQAALPALAAALFLGILLWPEADSQNGPTMVAGVVVPGLDQMVNPALEAVADTRKAAANLNQVLGLSVGQARQQVLGQFGRSEPGQHPAPAVSFTDILLQPFNALLEQPKHPPAKDAGPPLVRF